MTEKRNQKGILRKMEELKSKVCSDCAQLIRIHPRVSFVSLERVCETCKVIVIEWFEGEGDE